MLNRKKFLTVILALSCIANVCFSQELEKDWNDFLHYVKIGQLDLAKGFAEKIISSDPDPVKLLSLSEQNPQGYSILLRITEKASDTELVNFTDRILKIIEKGRVERRTEPSIIAEQVRKLSSTARAKYAAVKRLRNAGEYAVPYMLDALSDPGRREEHPNIIWALPQVGKDAIRPLCTAVHTGDPALKAEIIKTLGKIGYPQSLACLKYVMENSDSPQMRSFAVESIEKIDPAARRVPAAQLYFNLAENYYYHSDSLNPAEDADFANIWFWDEGEGGLIREKVGRKYFYELMAMRCCEWSLKSDEAFGKSIGLWLSAFFNAESTGLDMPDYFGDGHAGPSVYATTAGPEYLHQALDRAVKDENAYLALGVIEALSRTAGEKSLFYTLGTDQPLLKALSFSDRAVRYSAAIAIGAAGPRSRFAERRLVIDNLSEAVAVSVSGEVPAGFTAAQMDEYALKAADVMLQLARTRNPVIDLSDALDVLQEAIKADHREIQVMAGRILARIDSPGAQRSIAAMALEEENPIEIRISGFESLAVSAKINANLLTDSEIDLVYSIVSSQDTEPELRKAAAAAFGSLNLPSRKVKMLVIDQARN